MGLSQSEQDFFRCDTTKLPGCAADTADMLRSFAHEGRFLILWHLTSGEKTVTELCSLIDCRQSAISQQIGRLRMEGIVKRRRDGKAIYYRFADPRHAEIINTVQKLFCADCPTTNPDTAD